MSGCGGAGRGTFPNTRASDILDRAYLVINLASQAQPMTSPPAEDWVEPKDALPELASTAHQVTCFSLVQDRLGGCATAAALGPFLAD